MAKYVPVPFADLGKPTNDLLGKDFPVGQTKFELKTVAPNGVIEVENKVAKGLKLDISGGFLPSEGKKNAKVGVQYKQLGFNSRAYVDLFKGPTFTGDVVVGRDGFSLGGDVAYDVGGAHVSRFAAAAAYTAP
ncbi:Mitochondrial porin, partial [Podila epigama]